MAVGRGGYEGGLVVGRVVSLHMVLNAEMGEETLPPPPRDKVEGQLGAPGFHYAT